MTLNVFPLAWYPFLAGGTYLLYEYYIASTHYWHSIFTSSSRHDPAIDIMVTCILYLSVELAQYALSRTSHHSTPPKDIIQVQRSNEGAHVIIAAHKAFDSLQKILPSVLAAFPAQHIWVADNGLERDDATQRHCQELGIQYRFYPVPNKTYALYKTAEEIYDTYHDQASSLVLLDDDTQLPDGFFVRRDLLQQPLVAGYCVGIGIQKTPPYNLLEHLIDFEYRTISYHNECKASKGTIHFLHGICAIYNTRRMLMIYSKLCTLPHGLPFGEDSFAGVDCRLAGYRLLQDNQNVVTTFCPRRIFPPCVDKGREQGFGASSVWKQRALRWYLSWPRRLPSELALGLCYDAGNWVGNVLYRVDLLWYLVIVLVSSFWPFYMVHIGIKHQSWALLGYLHLCMYGTSTLTALIRYTAFPDTLKQGVDKRVILLVPALNLVVCLMMACSFFMSLLYYIPFRRIDYQKCYANAV